MPVAMSLVLGGCASLRYYSQAVAGQGALILHRKPVRQLLFESSTDPALAARLDLALRARAFASTHLGLPDNRSYTGYVDLHRAYVVWNVFAAPRFSVRALPQCFPFAGCVAYRGYFHERAARADAQRLRQHGYDVWIGGVPAYSTLGWFADPIVSSMLRWDDDELDGTIFHELAHQLIYVKGDTAFNESFATFVQKQGLLEWRKARGLSLQANDGQAMDDGFTDLILDLRRRLQKLYASGLDQSTMAAAKRQEIQAFRLRYRHWQATLWPTDHRYDAWVSRPINNARLLPFGLYDRWTAAFARLFRQADRHWPAFYASVRTLAKDPPALRQIRLQQLMVATASVSRNPCRFLSAR